MATDDKTIMGKITFINHDKEYATIEYEHNGKKKTINVSAELINYKPVSLDYIFNLGLDSIERMDTVESSPIRK